jgi:hypothetical protein
MPDGDLYNRNVARRSQNAARYFYEFDDPEAAIREAMRVLTKCLAGQDTSEILEIVRLGVTEEWGPWVRAELERVRRHADSVIVEIAAERAMLHQADPEAMKGQLSADSGPEGIKSVFLKDVLVAFIGAEVSPRRLQAAFNQKRPEDKAKCRDRCQANLDALRKSPILDSFVQKRLLLETEGKGDKVKKIHPRVQKPSQEEIVHSALPL